MPNEQEMKRLSASHVRPYPPSDPADLETQHMMGDIWRNGINFLIISGAPGVGKTRAAEDYVAQLLNDHNAKHNLQECRITELFADYTTKIYSQAEITSILQTNSIEFVWDIIVLHPQYSYEDLIRGSRFAPGNGLDMLIEVREGILGFISRVVSSISSIRPESPYPRGILIMDEINRAPIGQLFGEAIYALDRRGTPVTTPYYINDIGSSISIPKELFVVATMNSIDRSISGFDFALRRRFSLLNLASNINPITDRWLKFGENYRKFAENIYDSVKKVIMNATPRGIVPREELILGHAFFLPPKHIVQPEKAVDWLANAYTYKILPTLMDYAEQGLLDYGQQHMEIFEAGVLNGEKSLATVKCTLIEEQMLLLLKQITENPSQ